MSVQKQLVLPLVTHLVLPLKVSYGDKIADLFGIPVDYQDERLTTVQAERMLVEQADVSRGKRKKVIDKLAAQLILQNYLDRMF